MTALCVVSGVTLIKDSSLTALQIYVPMEIDCPYIRHQAKASHSASATFPVKHLDAPRELATRIGLISASFVLVRVTHMDDCITPFMLRRILGSTTQERQARLCSIDQPHW